MSRTLFFSTGNQGKLNWLKNCLTDIADLQDIIVQGDATETTEIQSSSLADISLHKAQQAFDRLQKPVISLDAGFYINEWNGFPGPFAKYMIEQLDVTHWTNLIRNLTNKKCEFKNCLTLIDVNNTVTQFHDTTGDIFTLTDHAWPEDHPDQWSKIWRFIVPAGLGYDKPLAGFEDKALQEYMIKRNALNSDNTCFALLTKHILANPACLG